MAAATLTDHRIRSGGVSGKLVEQNHDGLQRRPPYRFFEPVEIVRESSDRNDLHNPNTHRERFADVETTGEIDATEAVTGRTGEPNGSTPVPNSKRLDATDSTRIRAGERVSAEVQNSRAIH